MSVFQAFNRITQRGGLTFFAPINAAWCNGDQPRASACIISSALFSIKCCTSPVFPLWMARLRDGDWGARGGDLGLITLSAGFFVLPDIYITNYNYFRGSILFVTDKKKVMTRKIFLLCTLSQNKVWWTTYCPKCTHEFIIHWNTGGAKTVLFLKFCNYHPCTPF